MTATNTTVLEAVLRRDRLAVIAALIVIIALAWIYILLGAGTGMNRVAMIRRNVRHGGHADGAGGMDPRHMPA